MSAHFVALVHYADIYLAFDDTGRAWSMISGESGWSRERKYDHPEQQDGGAGPKSRHYVHDDDMTCWLWSGAGWSEVVR